MIIRNLVRIVILLIGVSPVFLSSCEEDKYGDWKVLNENWMENIKATYANDSNFFVTKSGLCYRVIHQSYPYGTKPYIGSIIYATYSGKLVTGKSFDSGNYANYLSAAIQGWQEGIPKMSRGSHFIFYVPYQLGYGTSASGLIPPYSVLEFDVELIDVRN